MQQGTIISKSDGLPKARELDKPKGTQRGSSVRNFILMCSIVNQPRMLQFYFGVKLIYLKKLIFFCGSLLLLSMNAYSLSCKKTDEEINREARLNVDNTAKVYEKPDLTSEPKYWMILGEKKYITLEKRTIFVEKCRRGEWSLIDVTFPSGMIKDGDGWIMTKYISPNRVELKASEEANGTIYCKDIGSGRKRVWLNTSNGSYALNGPAIEWVRSTGVQGSDGKKFKLGRDHFSSSLTSRLIKEGLENCD